MRILQKNDVFINLLFPFLSDRKEIIFCSANTSGTILKNITMFNGKKNC